MSPNSPYPPVRRTGYWFWYGQIIPTVYTVEFSPEDSRRYANPSTRRDVLERLVRAIADQFVADKGDEEIDRGALRSKIERAIANRHGRPTIRLDIWVNQLPTRALTPVIDTPESVPIPAVPPSREIDL